MVWGLALFGGVLDRYVATFPNWPAHLNNRCYCLGTIPALLAEAINPSRECHVLAQNCRAAKLCPLAIATALDFERLFFLLLILPLIALFYASFGVMGGWVGRRSGAVVTVGVGLAFVSMGLGRQLSDACRRLITCHLKVALAFMRTGSSHRTFPIRK